MGKILILLFFIIISYLFFTGAIYNHNDAIVINKQQVASDTINGSKKIIKKIKEL